MPISRHVATASRKVTNLSTPLKGMPIEVLLAADTQVTDLSPLAESKTLTDLTLPPDAKDIEFLRTFPKLERLGFGIDPRTLLPIAEFWKEWDAKRQATD